MQTVIGFPFTQSLLHATFIIMWLDESAAEPNARLSPRGSNCSQNMNGFHRQEVPP